MKKVVKKADPKKRAVVEKKTGEKYASKAMMAKHEKGESKKMRMMEGEIPMKRKGGKSCSCGKASCMMCGGVKKHQFGGFQTQMGKIMKSQGQSARRAGLTKKLDGMGLFEMSEMKVKPVRKGATGAELKAEGMALKKKGMALKAKGQKMRAGGVKKYQDGGFQTQLGKLMKSQGQSARRAGLTKKLDGMGLFEMSEMKVKPIRKGATGAELKAEGIRLQKKGAALKAKGQRMRKGGKMC